eukprot:5356874-Pleurochrysis_carterae.AAC.1
MVEVGVEQVHNPPHQPGRERGTPATPGQNEVPATLLQRQHADLSLRRFALAPEGAAAARVNLSLDWLVRANCALLSRGSAIA